MDPGKVEGGPAIAHSIRDQKTHYHIRPSVRKVYWVQQGLHQNISPISTLQIIYIFLINLRGIR